MPDNVIRLIAIDLDGTLLDSRKQLSPRVVAAIQALADRGIRTIIASARPPRAIRSIYRSLNLNTWQINYNGAMIWDEPAARMQLHQPIPAHLVRRMIAGARSIYPNVILTCEIQDKWFTDRDDRSHTTETGKQFNPDLVAPLDDWCNVPVTKLMFLADPAPILKLQHILTQRFGDLINLVRSDEDLIQIMHPMASKGAALRVVAAHYGVPLNQVLAIGDALNDMEMLRSAGTAVAVANAHPQVKSIAHWTAPSNDHDGVYAALKHFGLAD